MNALAKLLTDCDAHGIHLAVADDGGLAIDAPRDVLTPGFVDRLRVHKAELLTLLRPSPSIPGQQKTATKEENGSASATAAKPVCRCGSTTWRDVPIHGGQSIRRECGWCRRFIDFPVWYGKGALRNEQ
jgi:hypothetical protein